MRSALNSKRMVRLHHPLLSSRSFDSAFPLPLLAPMIFSHDDTSDPSTASAVIKGVSKAPEGISAWRGFPPFFYLTPPSGCVLAVLAHCSFPLLRQQAVTKGTSDVPVGILRTAVTHQRAICAEQLFSTLRRLQGNATPGFDRLSAFALVI